MTTSRSQRDAAGRDGPDPGAHRLMRTRRHFFRDCGVGVGKIALATLLAESQARIAWAGAEPERSIAPRDVPMPRTPHFAPKARRVIFLFMAGRPANSTCSTTSRPCGSTTAGRSPPRSSRTSGTRSSGPTPA